MLSTIQNRHKKHKDFVIKQVLKNLKKHMKKQGLSCVFMYGLEDPGNFEPTGIAFSNGENDDIFTIENLFSAAASEIINDLLKEVVASVYIFEDVTLEDFVSYFEE